MKPINIYTLSRITNETQLTGLDRQMSKRSYPLKIKSWEVESVRMLADRLYGILGNISLLNFYYSFQIPKLGKEFDLLCVSDNKVINIELKSRDVSDEKIKKQLEQNRQYLSLLGKNIRSYTYISDQDRLVRYTNSGRLVESDMEQLAMDMQNQDDFYEDHLEKLFVEEKYLVSPLTDPDKFLRREYFLTSQQRDIKKKILGNIGINPKCIQGFTGLPGTGKTLLLYDIAMEMSDKDKVCVLHYGSYPEEMVMLNSRLKRIDFYQCNGNDTEYIQCINQYKAVFIDEGHRISKDVLQQVVEITSEAMIPVIISYDNESGIATSERRFSNVDSIEALPEYVKYTLTNRIRMNAELSSFIGIIMKLELKHRRKEYPSVSVSYANNANEATAFVKDYKHRGYIYIRKANEDIDSENHEDEIDSTIATCKEFDKVVMVIDDSYSYDNEGNLISSSCESNESSVRMLFHGLSRAKSQIALVVVNNASVFDNIMKCLQG